MPRASERASPRGGVRGVVGVNPETEPSPLPLEGSRRGLNWFGPVNHQRVLQRLHILTSTRNGSRPRPFAGAAFI